MAELLAAAITFGEHRFGSASAMKLNASAGDVSCWLFETATAPPSTMVLPIFRRGAVQRTVVSLMKVARLIISLAATGERAVISFPVPMKKMQLSKELLRKDTPVMRMFCMLDISTVLGDTIPRDTAGTYEKRAFSPLPKSTPFVDTATLTVVGRGCAGAEHIMTLLDTYCALLGGAFAAWPAMGDADAAARDAAT